MADWLVFRHAPLIGTTVEVRVSGAGAAEAVAIDAAVAAEMIRLEGVFNAFDDESELSRWKRDSLAEPSPEFCSVMASALDWQVRSGGRFHPLAGALSNVWREAERAGRLPERGTLAALAAAIAEPCYRISGGRPVRTGVCAELNLNAIAKGFIVDRALRAVEGADVSVVINAGGDLAHRGRQPIDVGIENPRRPFDNEPPILVLPIANAAVATSGGYRRGFRVHGRRHSHVIDPRSGWTADRITSITVIAGEAMTADVVATVLGVLEPAEAVAEAPVLGVRCVVVTPDGVVLRSEPVPGVATGA